MKPRTALVLLALVALVLLIWRPGRGPRQMEIGVTSSLAGRWTTSDSRYADRFLEIGPDEITIGQGADGEARYPLRGVFLETKKDGSAVYVLRYQIDDRGDATADLRLVMAGEALRIENQTSITWSRSP